MSRYAEALTSLTPAFANDSAVLSRVTVDRLGGFTDADGPDDL